MKAIVYTRPGDSSVLELVERDIPQPGPGEVRVKVMVSGVNPTDWKTRTNPSTSGESVPNQDGAGVIDAVGPALPTDSTPASTTTPPSAATTPPSAAAAPAPAAPASPASASPASAASAPALAVGDRVWLGISGWERPLGGTAQEYTIALAERVFPLPDEASFDLGASLGVPAVTAHRALTVGEIIPNRLAPGSLAGAVILVAGGAGAVGHAAIQLARWAGATVIATVSGAEKAELATKAGAHHVVNYRDADAAAQIRAIAPAGVDHIVEVAAGTNAALNLAVIKPRGTIASYANDGGAPITVDMRPSMTLNVRYQFVLIYTMGKQAWVEAAEDINAALRDGALPIGADAGMPLHYFTLEQTAAAHDAVQNSTVGKVLINVG